METPTKMLLTKLSFHRLKRIEEFPQYNRLFRIVTVLFVTGYSHQNRWSVSQLGT